MDLLNNLFTPATHVYWVESMVILCILVFLFYVSYSLNLFRKE